MTRRKRGLPRPRLQSQAEIDHAYWRERVVLAVAALERVEDDLLESQRRFQIARERLAASPERGSPNGDEPIPVQLNPKWWKEEAS
jgi:hypothetical protein